jgi:hypothetical protein
LRALALISALLKGHPWEIRIKFLTDAARIKIPNENTIYAFKFFAGAQTPSFGMNTREHRTRGAVP